MRAAQPLSTASASKRSIDSGSSGSLSRLCGTLLRCLVVGVVLDGALVIAVVVLRVLSYSLLLVNIGELVEC